MRKCGDSKALCIVAACRAVLHIWAVEVCHTLHVAGSPLVYFKTKTVEAESGLTDKSALE